MWRLMLTLAVGFLPQAAFANLIVNGDFETGDVTGWEVSQFQSGTSVTSFDLFGDGESLVFDSWGGQDGTAKVDQYVNLTAGDIFTVSWDQAFFNDGPTTIQSGVFEFEVRVTGNGRIHISSQGVLAADEVTSQVNPLCRDGRFLQIGGVAGTRALAALAVVGGWRRVDAVRPRRDGSSPTQRAQRTPLQSYSRGNFPTAVSTTHLAW